MLATAILLAAGGADSPALIPVANRPLVLHALAWLAQAGVTRVAIVSDRETGERVKRAVTDGEFELLEITWIRSVRPRLVTALRAAEELIRDQPFILHLGDSLSRRELSTLTGSASIGRCDALSLVQRSENAPRVNIVPLRGRERGSIERASPAGVYVLGPGIVEVARGLPGDAEVEQELMAGLTGLERLGGRMQTCPVQEWWRHGHGGGVLEANHFALDGLDSDYAGAELIRTEVQGSVVIDPSARLMSSIVRGPAVIGPRAQLIEAYIGPYTAIGEDVVVDGAEIERSVILPRASITHLGARLEESVVGAAARVTRDFRLPRALRVHVGDGARISLA